MDTLSSTDDQPFPPFPLQRAPSAASVVLDPVDLSVEAADSSGAGRKLPSSQFKGVVPQPNGRWGAQIYEKHQRVWLGTFNLEADAARAYDVAAQRFRGRDSVTNFKPLSDSDDDGASELAFLASRSKSEVVDMLRKHTYHEELQQSRRSAESGDRRRRPLSSSPSSPARAGGPNGAQRRHLFDKAVTPSDVGKLNRLVIPKQHAERHFPLPEQGAVAVSGDVAAKGVLLNFEDDGGKVWRFRYSYWNSSQSYVLTKGWSRFVKEKGLKAGDLISFMRSSGEDQQLFIEWRACGGTTMTASGTTTGMVRLFGVDIVANAVKTGGEGGKRSRENLGLKEGGGVVVKKQCIEAL